MQLTELSSHAVLSENGLLQQSLPGCNYRPSQLQMAEAIENAIENKQKVLIEAATGTGKTFAYLIPAILAGKKILISTGTKNLQDQLFKKDIPELAKILKLPIKAALLKGRSNYLCKHRLEIHQYDNKFFSRELISELYRLNVWQNQTKQGDKAEINFIPENSEVWPLVTSTKDNCLGQECEHYKKCFLVQARKKAIEADIIVINHHLFFADLLVKEEGFGELLPEVDVVIFDEAHQLPEIASIFLGESFSARRIIDLAKDSISETINAGLKNSRTVVASEKLQKTLADMRLAFGTELTRKPWNQICHKKVLQDAIAEVKLNLAELYSALEAESPNHKGIAACYERSIELKNLFDRVTSVNSPNTIHWYETFPKTFVIHLTPLDIANDMLRIFSDNIAWIFTSATIAVKDSFEFYQKRMGLKASTTLQIESHYDFLNQAKLYLPAGLPEPSDPTYIKAITEKIIPVIEHYQGRTFFLFTSYAALNQAAEILKNRIDFPLLLQGQKPKQALLNDFIQLGNAVLLGTSSFWEGVDVKGEALSCVIIDKLPFAAPNDPVLQARINAMRQQGEDPFYDFQLPQAVIALKQGVGRLIRDENDTGMIVLCDPRLTTKPYGKLFLESLPQMQRVEKLAFN